MPATMTRDDGSPIRCDICGASSVVDVSRPPGDSVCPVCGSFLWVDALVDLTSRNGFFPDVRLPRLYVRTRDEAVSEIVSALADECRWSDEQYALLVEAVLDREALGTTGIGRGLALPHAYVGWIDRCVTAFAYLPVAVDFNAVDSRRVHTVALMASPTHRRAEGLLTICKIAESLQQLGRHA